MTVVSKTVLKSYFNTGDKPTEEQFANLIDTLFALGDNSSDDIAEGSSNLFLTPAQSSKIGELNIVEATTVDTGALTAGVAKTVTHGLGLDTERTILQARDDSDSNNVQVALLQATDTNNVEIKSNVDLTNLKIKIIGIKS